MIFDIEKKTRECTAIDGEVRCSFSIDDDKLECIWCGARVELEDVPVSDRFDLGDES